MTNALLEKETRSITISIGLHLAITSQANAANYDTRLISIIPLQHLIGIIWIRQAL